MKQQDFMSHELHLPELTMRGMLLGALITIIFTASNVYLGLKVGLTFSSSIPAAVISMAILRMFKDSNILENNLVQTQASAAGTLSAVIFVIPGLLMLGYWQGFPFWQTLLLCACGGSLGVLFTIPLRRAMVVNSDLTYPEGRAAAEILKVGSGAEGGTGGMQEIVAGGVVAGVVSFLSSGLRAVAGEMSYWFTVGASTTQLPLGFSLALLCAGYLIGISSGVAILVGLTLAWGILVPYLTSIYTPEATQTAAQFAGYIWKSKVRFIGAGCMAIAAIYTLIMLAKPIWEGVLISVQSMKMSQEERESHRMDTDMTPKSIAATFALILLGLVITFYSFVMSAPISQGLMWVLVLCGIVVSLAIGFFVAAACGYMAGLIGTSASPISGIGIIGIIVSSLVVFAISSSTGIFATPEGTQFATALAIFMTSVVVCIAAISNDNLQDLKTGQLVGATPWRQQVALLLGSVFGAITIAPVLNLLYEAYGFTGALPRAGMDPAQALSAPQATLMTTIAQGIFSQNLDWTFIFIGIGIGVVGIIINAVLKSSTNGRLSLPPLAIGMGIYLPPSLEMPLIMGSFLSYFLLKKVWQRAKERNGELAAGDVDQCNRRGVLFASGLIVGESLVGVLIAVIIVLSVTSGGSEEPLAIKGISESVQNFLGLAAFVGTMAYLAKLVWSAKLNKEELESFKEAE